MSYFGLWPYQCASCGISFFLKKRYPSRKKTTAAAAAVPNSGD